MLAFVVIESLLETLLTSQLHILGGCEEFNGPWNLGALQSGIRA